MTAQGQTLLDAEVLERLRQAMLKLNAQDMREAAASEAFNMKAMEQITKHFEWLVERKGFSQLPEIDEAMKARTVT